MRKTCPQASRRRPQSDPCRFAASTDRIDRQFVRPTVTAGPYPSRRDSHRTCPRLHPRPDYGHPAAQRLDLNAHMPMIHKRDVSWPVVTDPRFVDARAGIGSVGLPLRRLRRLHRTAAGVAEDSYVGMGSAGRGQGGAASAGSLVPTAWPGQPLSNFVQPAPPRQSPTPMWWTRRARMAICPVRAVAPKLVLLVRLLGL
jgi:hypothetical protein